MHVLAGSSYYDNVRPLAYPDSDAVLICFDISRPETLDSVLKKVSQSSTTHCHPLTDHASLISLSLSLLPFPSATLILFTLSFTHLLPLFGAPDHKSHALES